MESELNTKEKQILLKIARQAIEKAVKKEDPILYLYSKP